MGDRPRSTCTSPGRGWSPSEPAHHCLHGWELQITVSINRDLGRLDWGTSGQLIASRSPGLGVGVPQTVTTFPLLPRCVSVQHAISNSNDHCRNLPMKFGLFFLFEIDRFRISPFAAIQTISHTKFSIMVQTACVPPFRSNFAADVPLYEKP